jgi:hypothetical protein
MKYIKSKKISNQKYILTLEVTEKDMEMLEDLNGTYAPFKIYEDNKERIHIKDDVDLSACEYTDKYKKFINKLWSTFWKLWNKHDEYVKKVPAKILWTLRYKKETMKKKDNEKINVKLFSKDILMIEKFINKHTGEFKMKELFNKLPKKISWGYFKKIINHLFKTHKIVYDSENYLGYVWDDTGLIEKYKNKKDLEWKPTKR